MKLKFDIEIDLSARQRRALSIGAALAIGLSATVAWADVPKTFAQGKTLKAADLNASFGALDQRLTAVEQRPRSRVAVKALLPFSIPANTTSKLSFATEQYDDLEEYDAVSSSFTATAAGDYEVCLSVATIGANNGAFEIFVEGVSRGTLLRTENLSSACRTTRVDAGDIIDLRMRNLYAATTAITGGDNEAWLTINQLD